MKPLDGFRDDLVDTIGRLRERIYPELANADVAKVLRSVSQSYWWTDSQARARAFSEFQDAQRASAH